MAAVTPLGRRRAASPCPLTVAGSRGALPRGRDWLEVRVGFEPTEDIWEALAGVAGRHDKPLCHPTGGALGRSRTAGRLVRTEPLCPLSYEGAVRGRAGCTTPPAEAGSGSRPPSPAGAPRSDADSHLGPGARWRKAEGSNPQVSPRPGIRHRLPASPAVLSVAPAGFEPATSTLKGWRLQPLVQGAVRGAVGTARRQPLVPDPWGTVRSRRPGWLPEDCVAGFLGHGAARPSRFRPGCSPRRKGTPG